MAQKADFIRKALQQLEYLDDLGEAEVAEILDDDLDDVLFSLVETRDRIIMDHAPQALPSWVMCPPDDEACNPPDAGEAP